MNNEYILTCIAGVVLFITAIPLAFGKISINSWYGVRTRSTMRDERLWYRANKIYGWSAMIVNIIFFLVYYSCGSWMGEKGGEGLRLDLLLFQALSPVALVSLFLCYRWWCEKYR